MADKEKVAEAVSDAINEINKDFPKEKQFSKSTETALFGNAGVLDSLGLINLITASEQAVEKKFGIKITLTDERVISQNSSPFETVGSLIDYITLLLEEKQDQK